jgi:hypothetical protein
MLRHLSSGVASAIRSVPRHQPARWQHVLSTGGLPHLLWLSPRRRTRHDVITSVPRPRLRRPWSSAEQCRVDCRLLPLGSTANQVQPFVCR